MATISRYLFAWTGLVIIAVLNGTLRVTAFSPHMSDLLAHQLSTVAGIMFFSIYLWFLSRFWPIPSAGQAAIIGCMWLIMTIAFEFLFGHYIVGHSWNKLLADYNIFEGRLWVLILIWTLVAPYVFYKWKSRMKPGT